MDEEGEGNDKDEEGEGDEHTRYRERERRRSTDALSEKLARGSRGLWRADEAILTSPTRLSTWSTTQTCVPSEVTVQSDGSGRLSFTKDRA